MWICPTCRFRMVPQWSVSCMQSNMLNAQLAITHQPLLLPFVGKDMRIRPVTFNTWQPTCICRNAACLKGANQTEYKVTIQKHSIYLFKWLYIVVRAGRLTQGSEIWKAASITMAIIIHSKYGVHNTKYQQSIERICKICLFLKN